MGWSFFLNRIAALGLDVGKKRIGVAGCDALGLCAVGLTTVIRTYWTKDMELISAIVQDREVQILVVGLPYNMDGSIGQQAIQVQRFAERAAQHLKLPLEYVDERLTSYAAEQLLINEKLSLRDHKALIDRKAAAIILQQWLDQQRHEEGMKLR